MNDKFLSDYQEEPRPEFAKALIRRINTPLPPAPRRQGRPALWAALAALALVLGVLLFPPARAAAQTIIARIGGLLILREPTQAEQFEAAINAPQPSATPENTPAPVEWQAPPLLSVEEAAALAGFTVSEITALPPGLVLAARFVDLPEEGRAYTRVSSAYGSPGMNLALLQTVYQPGAAAEELPAGEAEVVPVTVQQAEGVWIENLRLSTYVDANNQVAPRYASLLVWVRDGMEYRLQSTPGLPLDDMLAIAASLQP